MERGAAIGPRKDHLLRLLRVGRRLRRGARASGRRELARGRRTGRARTGELASGNGILVGRGGVLAHAGGVLAAVLRMVGGVGARGGRRGGVSGQGRVACALALYPVLVWVRPLAGVLRHIGWVLAVHHVGVLAVGHVAVAAGARTRARLQHVGVGGHGRRGRRGGEQGRRRDELARGLREERVHGVARVERDLGVPVADVGRRRERVQLGALQVDAAGRLAVLGGRRQRLVRGHGTHAAVHRAQRLRGGAVVLHLGPEAVAVAAVDEGGEQDGVEHQQRQPDGHRQRQGRRVVEELAGGDGLGGAVDGAALRGAHVRREVLVAGRRQRCRRRRCRSLRRVQEPEEERDDA